MLINELLKLRESTEQDLKLEAAFKWLKDQGYRYRKNTGDTGNGEEAKTYAYRIVNGSLQADERSDDGAGEKGGVAGTLRKLGVRAKFIGHMVYFG